VNQCKALWRCSISHQTKASRFAALVGSKILSGLFHFPLTHAQSSRLDYLQARGLRRLQGQKAAYVSRISNKTVRATHKVKRWSIVILRQQLLFLGKVLRSPVDSSLRLSCFEPHTNLKPREPPGHKRKQGRPRLSWAQVLIENVCKQHGMTRLDLKQLAQNVTKYMQYVECLCERVQTE